MSRPDALLSSSILFLIGASFKKHHPWLQNWLCREHPKRKPTAPDHSPRAPGFRSGRGHSKYWFGGGPSKPASLTRCRSSSRLASGFHDLGATSTTASATQVAGRYPGLQPPEAQHSIVHNQYNAFACPRRRRGRHDRPGWKTSLFDKLPITHFRWGIHLAITAGLEHFTAISAHAMFDKRDIMGEAHPNVRAMHAWHAIEERLNTRAWPTTS